MRDFTIYMHVNKINGKKYVGISSQDLQKRWGYSNGNGYSTQIFYNAIQKYGWNNFDHIILEENVPESIVRQKEDEYILKYESLTTQHGYNVRLNISVQGLNLSYKLVTKIYQYNVYGEFLKEYCSIAAAAREYNVPGSNIGIAASRKLYAYGYLWAYAKDLDKPEDFLQYYDRFRFERFFPIYQFDLNGKYVASYDSVDAAVKSNDKKWLSDFIMHVCRGIYRSGYGFVWRFQIDVPDIKNFEATYVLPPVKRHAPNKVVRFDLDGHYLDEYDSVKVAADVFNCTPQTIKSACNGKALSGVGYLWKYKKDYKGGDITPYRSYKKKYVVQKDLNNNIIAYYDSCKAAAQAVGAIGTEISSICTGKHKTARGFKWEHIDKKDIPSDVVINTYVKN